MKPTKKEKAHIRIEAELINRAERWALLNAIVNEGKGSKQHAVNELLRQALDSYDRHAPVRLQTAKQG